MSDTSSGIVKRLYNTEVEEFKRTQIEAWEKANPTAPRDVRDTAMKAINEKVVDERLKIADSFFLGGDEKLPSGIFDRFGLASIKNPDAPADAGVDVKVIVRDGKTDKLVTYAEVRALEEAKLSAFKDTSGALTTEGKQRLAGALMSWAPKFYDANIDKKAKEIAEAYQAVTVAASKVGEEYKKATKEDRDPYTDSLEREVEIASNRLDDLIEKKDKYAERFKEDMQQSIADAVDSRAAVLEVAWTKENPHIAALAEEHHPESDRLKGKYDAKRVTPTVSIDESEKLYNKLKDADLVTDSWAEYFNGVTAKLAAKKQYASKVGDDDVLNAAGKAEAARLISKFTIEKKDRYFKKFQKGFDLKKQWYEAAIAVIETPENDSAKQRKAENAERAIKQKLDNFEASVPTAFKDEMELILNGRAGKYLDDAKFKKLQDSNIVDIDQETYDKMKEEAKKLKDYEKDEKAKVENKGTLASGDKGKGSGKGWMAAAALAGAAIAGTAALTGEDKVENEGKENETRKSKWTFGRVIATVVGVITLGLAVEGLARGDKSFVGKYMAEKGAKSTSALTGLLNGRG